MDKRLTDYQEKKTLYDSLSTSIKEIEKRNGSEMYPEAKARVESLYKERDEIAKELKDIENELMYRCRTISAIEKAMMIDKFINGLTNKQLANKYTYSYGAIRNKITKILKRIGMN